jgi:acetylornithine deacetylase/succinyl-diaminopimelate desuccinylase family protein
MMSSADRDEGAVLSDLDGRVLAAIDDGETLDLLRRLVRTPSANPPGNEGDVARVLAQALDRGGVDARLEDVHPGRPNVAAELGPADGPTLLLNGHSDTMPPGEGWTTDPYVAIVRAGMLYGLGACDMKAGVAAMTEAVLAVKRSGIPLRGRVSLDVVVDEEATGAGTKYTVAHGRRADFAVIAEPTDLQVIRLGNGQVNFQVRFQGKAGHGSTPEAGRNAISDAAAFVSLVESEVARLARSPHPLIGPASYNIGRIQGGLQTSIIPSECVVGVDRRIVPGQSVRDAIADLDALLARVAAERPGSRAERTVEIEYEPFEVPADLPGCLALQRAAAESSSREIAFEGLRATTDAVYLTEAGTPTVIFGPGSLRQAHQPDEFVSLEQLHQATRAFALTIIRLLA